MNKETAIANSYLNRINQYSPWGSTTYQVTGTNPDGTPQFRQDVNLDPSSQRQLDLQNAIAEQLGGFASSSIGRVEDVMSQPFSFTGLPDMVSGVDLSKLPGFSQSPAGQVLRTGFGNPGDVQRQLGLDGLPSQYGGNVQGDLDFSRLSAIPGIGDFSADRKKVEDALYGRATARLDPRFKQQQSELENQLVNMGIPRGSEAWNRELDNFGRTRNDAYSQALNDAILAGGGEQSRIFGLGLTARQQGANEALTQGQFHNAADLQRFNMAGSNRNQAFNERVAAGEFANTAQAQAYEQARGAAEFENAARTGMFDQDLARATFDNTQRGQQYQELANNAALQNQARQSGITEQSYLRNLPLNEIATLLGTAGPVQQPQFSGVPGSNIAGTNLMGAVYDSYNGQMNAWQAKQAARQSALGGIFGLAGSLGGAAIMSDRKFKHSIKRITETAAGIPLYVFSYIGEKARQFGTMAQDVFHIPGAVISQNGTFLVDYRKVWA